MPFSPSPSRRPDDHFRPDIEGLRGIAVLLVVLFHAGLAAIPGGFVGVDVFFVLSGFLITGLLVREHGRNGRIDLARFYARRIRRLAPAACIVLAAMLPLAYVVLDPLSRGEALVDGAASALSVANVRFADVASDYFAPGGAPSPFLHFWSLSVEEQFYLAWPALILFALRLRSGRRTALLLVGTVLGASLAAQLVVTDTAPGAAFYLLPTRAWQLAAGAMLALGAPELARLPGRLTGAVGWIGLVAIGASAMAIHGGMAYPGVAAILPTAGAVALIAGANRQGGPGRILALGPLRFVGRISYSLYLWHWPLLILGAAAAGSPLPATVRLGLVGLSFVLAAFSTLLVEEPIRHGLPAPTRRTLLAGTSAIAVIAIAGASLSVASARELERLDAGGDRDVPAEAAVVQPAEVEPDPVRGPAPDIHTPDGRATPEPAVEATAPPATAKPTAKPVAASRAGAPIILARPRKPSTSSGPFRPGLRDVRGDEERLKADRCIAYEPETQPRSCRYGKGRFTVALVGDSHASHWFPALHAVARDRNWTVVPLIKVSCPFIDMAVRSNTLKREYRECAAFNASVVERLEDLGPDLTIVALNQWVLPESKVDAKVARVGAALGRQLERIPGRAVVLADSPNAAEDAPTCLAANRDQPDVCTTPWAQAFSGHAAIEKVGAKAAGVPLIDLGPAICSSDPCQGVVDGMVVYRDHHHLTATFSRSLAPELDRTLRKAIKAAASDR